jgi:putative ABC transport system permease protein
MNLRKMIWKELRERPVAMFASLVAILLGVTAFVAIRSVGVSSERAVAEKLEALGANVLMLPKDVTLQDYYTADLNTQNLPEEHASRLVLANLEGVEHVSPRLCISADVNGGNVTLTGILPQSEFQAQTAWGGVQLFSNSHAGCKRAKVNEIGSSPESLATNRVVQELSEGEVLVGAEAAQRAGVRKGDKLTLLGKPFTVAGVLPAVGTVDDGRVFAHLHTVQELGNTGPVVNAIEIMGCCEDVAGDLVGRLQQMFPDTKVVTISQVVQTQVSVNRTMNRLSFLLFAVLIAIGGASMATAMYANVSERRREVGTLMALGATPGFVVRLFLWKAGVLGIVGGIGGAIAGTVLAVGLGPRMLDIPVAPLPQLGLIAVGVAVVVTLLASYLPAQRAATLDPCLCFKEV